MMALMLADIVFINFQYSMSVSSGDALMVTK